MPFTEEQVIQLVNDGFDKKIYKSKQWQKTRLIALKRDRNECQRCKAKGKYRKAKVVHHKEELKHNPARAFDIDNLESLCWECHELHHERENNLIDKKKFVNEERW